MNFDKTTIGSVCLVGDGAHASISRVYDGVPYLTSKNFNKEGINLKEVEYISEVDYSKHFRDNSKAVTKPKELDIVFSIIGSLGGAYLFKKSDRFGLSSSVAIIRANKNQVNSIYLLYFLKSTYLQKWVDSIKSGAAQGFLSLEMIKRLPLIIPPLPIQHKIASILSSYDELIENNNQRIKLLEEMAEEIYKEWFVRLRFPGYENTKFFNTEGKDVAHDTSGAKPEGWEKTTLPKYIDFLEGPGLLNSQYRDEGIRYLNIRVMGQNDLLIDKAGFLDKGDTLKRYPHFLLAENDHVVSSSGTIGRVVSIRNCHLPLCLNTSIIRMRSKTNNVGTWQLKHFLKSNIFQSQIASFAIGAAQANFGPTHLKLMKMLAPNEEIGLKYESITNPMEEEIKVLLDKNQLLKQTRDLLLPRLIGGKLSVEHLVAKGQEEKVLMSIEPEINYQAK